MAGCNQSGGAEPQSPGDDSEPSTVTSIEQAEVEAKVRRIFKLADNFPSRPILHKDRHVEYLMNGLNHLSCNYELIGMALVRKCIIDQLQYNQRRCLDASRPWLTYWILHSLELLDTAVDHPMSSRVVQFLSKCQHVDGGFCGGPGQLAHLATTYAAVLSLSILGTQEAYNCIDRPALQRFLIRLHQSDGSYIMHDDGEVDIRGAYLAVVAAMLSNVKVPIMFDKTAEWIASCQTYEGGFSAVPGTEAHGGYTFCGFAALVLLGQPQLCDVNKLLNWVIHRQMKFEGGFQGRTNKLVDGCYSFWQGGIFPLIQPVLLQQGDPVMEDEEHWLFDRDALTKYILLCSQNPLGGLLDKPGKSRDYYHTCYCLSGLSVCQHYPTGDDDMSSDDEDCVILKPTHPAYNIGPEKVQDILEHFSKLSPPIIISSTD